MNLFVGTGTILQKERQEGGALRFQVRQPIRRGDGWGVQYIRCKARGTTAEVIDAYYEEGSAIEIWGNLYTFRWQAPDGSQRIGFSILVYHAQSAPRAHPIPLEYEAEKSSREEITGWIPPIEIKEGEV